MKKFYESPEFELVSFETAEDFTVLSSYVDVSGGGNDNEIKADFWH